MIKVAYDIIADKTAKKGYRKINYNDVYFDSEGWADAKKFMPSDFDLVTVKSKDREISAWAVGNIWDGYRCKDGEEIISWRKVE